MSGQNVVSRRCLPQLPAELQDTACAWKERRDRGVHSGECRQAVSKDGSATNEGSLWELGQGAGSATCPCVSRNMEGDRPLVLVVISVRSEGPTHP